MPWARFEDDYLSNTKLATLSTSAICLDMATIVHSARELRDGVLTKADIQTVAALIHLKRWESASAELLRVNRWTVGPDGCYLIHDYLEYQPSRDQVLAERAAKHEAKVRAGRAGGLAKAKQNASSDPSKPLAQGVANAKQKSSPVPGPGPGPGPGMPAELASSLPPTPSPQAGKGAPPTGAQNGSSNGTALEFTPRARSKAPEPPAEPACCPDFARTGSEHWAYCPNAPQDVSA